MVVSDGTHVYPVQTWFINAPKEQLDQVLREYNLDPKIGEYVSPYPSLLINTGEHRVLVDTGAGDMTPTTGKLIPNLQAEGIAPEDIDTVILTHSHADHIGGNTGSEGKPAFPNARHIMWKEEWEFWTSEPDLGQLKVDEHLKKLLVTSARNNLPAIQGQLDAIDHEMEIVSGIHVVPAPGHTPGHIAVAISSGSEQLLHISDAALHPIHLEHPDWYPVFDLRPEQALVSKRQLMERAAAGKALVFGFHFPFPGLGHVVQKEEGWQWQPIETTG